MSTSAVLSFQVDTTDASADLGIEVWLDQEQLLNINWVQGPMDFQHEFVDDDAEHQLCFVLKNKRSEHTQVNENSDILKDARLTVSDVAFDQIKLGPVLTKIATYTHNTNGNSDTRQDKFYGELGCNGTVTLEFTTPIYLWLLEHM